MSMNAQFPFFEIKNNHTEEMQVFQFQYKKYRIIFLSALALLFFTYQSVWASVPDTASVVNTASINTANKSFEKLDFATALNLYQAALKSNPQNPNLNFKTALCNLYLLQHPQASSSMLKTALDNYNSKYNFYNSKLQPSSLDAYYYLAKSMMYAGQIDSAMRYLILYQTKLTDESFLDVNRQLKMCINAKQLMKTPRALNVTALEEPVNTEYMESNPVISIDNKVLLFASRRPTQNKEDITIYDSDIYYALANSNGTWSHPTAFNFNTDFDEEPLALSADGNTLYFRRANKKGKGDIYVSEKIDGQWTKPYKMKKVNTPYDENGFGISADKMKIVVSSNRAGGYGGYDLYVAKNKNGKFTKLKNMGKDVNTAMDEITPFISYDKRVYFATNGNTEYGMGGFDIFFTAADSGKKEIWAKPFTMGYPINKSGNELNYVLGSQGKILYTAVGNDGSLDIFEISTGEFEEEIDDAIVQVVGTSETQTVELLETEKDTEPGEVEVAKPEEVESVIEKEVGFVDADDAKNLDNVTAVQQEEVTVETVIDNTEETQDTTASADDSNINAGDVLDKMNKKDREELVDQIKKDLLMEINKNRSAVFKIFHFAFNSTEIKLEDYELKSLVEFLKENPKVNVEVVGHTDNLGAWETNFWISRERAKSMYDYLRTNKIATSRMIFNGKGAIMPIADNNTAVGRSQNRRVEIILIQ